MFLSASMALFKDFWKDYNIKWKGGVAGSLVLNAASLSAKQLVKSFLLHTETTRDVGLLAFCVRTQSGQEEGHLHGCISTFVLLENHCVAQSLLSDSMALVLARCSGTAHEMGSKAEHMQHVAFSWCRMHTTKRAIAMRLFLLKMNPFYFCEWSLKMR